MKTTTTYNKQKKMEEKAFETKYFVCDLVSDIKAHMQLSSVIGWKHFHLLLFQTKFKLFVEMIFFYFCFVECEIDLHGD